MDRPDSNSLAPRHASFAGLSLRLLLAACASGSIAAIAELLGRQIFLFRGKWMGLFQYVDEVVHTRSSWDCCGRKILARDYGGEKAILRFSQVGTGGREVDCRKQYRAAVTIAGDIPIDQDPVADDHRVGRMFQRLVDKHIFQGLREGRRGFDETRVRCRVQIRNEVFNVFFPRGLELELRNRWLSEQRFADDITAEELQQFIDRDFLSAKILSLDDTLNDRDRRLAGERLPGCGATFALEADGIIECIASEKSRRPDQFPGGLADLSQQARYDLTKAILEQLADGRLSFRDLPHVTEQLKSAVWRFAAMTWRKNEGRRPSPLYCNLARTISGNKKFRAAAIALGLIERVRKIAVMVALPGTEPVPRWLTHLLRALAVPGIADWSQLAGDLLGTLTAQPVTDEALDCAAFLNVAIGYMRDIRAMAGVPIDSEMAWEFAVTLLVDGLYEIPDPSPGSPLHPVLEALRAIEQDRQDAMVPPLSLQLVHDGQLHTTIGLAPVDPRVIWVPVDAGVWILRSHTGRELWSATLGDEQLYLGGTQRNRVLSLAASPVMPGNEFNEADFGRSTPHCGGLGVQILPGLGRGWLRIELGFLGHGGGHV